MDSEPQNPFASPKTVSSHETQITANLEDLPTRSRRLLAAIIDLAIVQVIAFFVARRFQGIPYNLIHSWFFDHPDGPYEMQDSDFILLSASIYLMMVIFSLFFYLLLNGYLLNSQGQTIGKALLKMKTVRRDGQPAGLMRLVFGRYAPLMLYFTLIFFLAGCGLVIPGFGILALFVLLSCLIDPLMIFTVKKRCLHDYIASTIVVKA